MNVCPDTSIITMAVSRAVEPPATLAPQGSRKGSAMKKGNLERRVKILRLNPERDHNPNSIKEPKFRKQMTKSYFLPDQVMLSLLA